MCLSFYIYIACRKCKIKEDVHYHMGCDARKPVWVSDQVRLKPVYSAIETRQNNEILHEASLDVILYSEQKHRH